MSRYHPVKPKQNKQSQTDRRAEQERQLQKAVEDTRLALYKQRDGESIDAAITRAEKTLALYDKELESLDEGEEKHRWKISPSVALRWQRELERQQQRREKLLNECHTMAKQLVHQWIDEGRGESEAQPEQQSAQPQAVPETSPHNAPATAERSHAEAGSSAAA